MRALKCCRARPRRVSDRATFSGARTHRSRRSVRGKVRAIAATTIIAVSSSIPRLRMVTAVECATARLLTGSVAQYAITS